MKDFDSSKMYTVQQIEDYLNNQLFTLPQGVSLYIKQGGLTGIKTLFVDTPKDCRAIAVAFFADDGKSIHQCFSKDVVYTIERFYA